MPLPYPSPPPGTKFPTIEGLEVKLYILERRKQNVSFPQIAQELDRTQGYVYKMYKKAIRDVLDRPVKEVVAIESAKLNDMENRIRELASRKYYLTNNGMVVRDTLETEDGNPVFDEEGNPVFVKMEDVVPLLQLMDRQLKVMERRAKLLGLDKPSKTALTNPNGDREAEGTVFYLPSNGRDEEADE